MANPLDLSIQDADAMRFALMANEGNGLATGGAVKDPSVLNALAAAKVNPSALMLQQMGVLMDSYGMSADEAANVLATVPMVPAPKAEPVKMAKGGVASFVKGGQAVPQVDASGNIVRAQPSPEQLDYLEAIRDPSLLDQVGGIGEAGLSFLTGVPATFAGLAGYGYGKLTGQDPKQTEAQWQGALQYRPTTPMGQERTEQLGTILNAIDPMYGMIGDVAKVPGVREMKASIKLADEAYNRAYDAGLVPQPGMSIKNIGDKLTPYEKAHQIAQRNAALPVEEGGLGLPQDNTFADRAQAQGYIDYLHGTQRMDRLIEKPGLDPKRATSGPMPYGTSEPEMASGYAMSKADTSRYDEGNMADYFHVSPKDLGSSGRSPVTVEQSWHYLPQEQKQKILSGYYRTGYANPEEASGPITLHPEGVHGSIASKDHLDFVLNKESRGNPLVALRKLWGESGQLFDNPEALADVYRVAGYPHEISQQSAPWTTAQGVLTGKVRMEKPLVTTDTDYLSSDVIPYLKEQFKNDHTRTKPGADQWSKESRYTPKEWVNELEKDIAEGNNSYVWTSIPDKVTKALSDAFGYDGIIDVGGKGGTHAHQVVIPFHAKQVRSKFAAFDPMQKESPDLLKAKGGPVHMAQGGDVNAMRRELAKPETEFRNNEGRYPTQFKQAKTPKIVTAHAASLVPTQDDFKKKTIKKYIKHPSSEKPDVVLDGKTGKYKIIDGHHRILADFSRGEDKIRVRVVGQENLDDMRAALALGK